MPRVYAVKARKDYPDQGIRRGDTYYKWRTRPGGRGSGITHRSATYPKPWQLTRSPFLQQLYLIQDEIANLETGEPGDGSLESEVLNLAQRLRELGEQCQESLDNMPDVLRETSESGLLLQERIDACEQAADDLEAAVSDLNSDSDQDDLDSALAEAQVVEVSC